MAGRWIMDGLLVSGSGIVFKYLILCNEHSVIFSNNISDFCLLPSVLYVWFSSSSPLFIRPLYTRAESKQTNKKFIICISLLPAVHCSHTNLCHIRTPAEKSAVSCTGNNINANFVFFYCFFLYILINVVMFILMCRNNTSVLCVQQRCGNKTSVCALCCMLEEYSPPLLPICVSAGLDAMNASCRHQHGQLWVSCGFWDRRWARLLPAAATTTALERSP